MTATVNLVTNPPGDDAFRKAAEHAQAHAATPAGLEEELRRDYPRVPVAQGISDRLVERWYVYREGHWIGDAPRVPMAADTAKLMRVRDTLSKIYAVVERNRELATRVPDQRSIAARRIAEGEQEIVFLETTISAMEAGWLVVPRTVSELREGDRLMASWLAPV